MDKTQLIEMLEEMATLLELDGANVFRSSAHTKAARALQDFDGDLGEVIEAGSLTELEGIGKGIADKITEYSRTGAIPELEELRAKFPAGVVEMTRIPGFGPKKVRAVYEELGVDSVEKLRKACEDGSIAQLKGFGAKTAEKILAGIEQMERFAGQYRLDKALAAAQPILEKLRGHDKVLEAEIGGSLRRCKEVVKDVDFVASTRAPKEVMKFFTSLPAVREVIAHGETKSSVRLAAGMQADLRCVTAKEYPYALLHFTGSKEHNTRLRGVAKHHQLKLNEYGLFPEGKDKPLPAKTEKDVYKHLKLDYVPPELREDRGEVEAAEEGRLPDLVRDEDVRGLLHIHTHYSDGKPTVEEYAQWALDNGLEWMGIADHSRSLTIARGLSEEAVLQQHREIDQVNKRYEPRGVRILKGIEADIMPDGSLDYGDEFLARFEFIVGSVHTNFKLSEKEQTKRVLKAIENPLLSVLGHMSGRLILARDAYAIDQREVIRRAGAAGVAIEINANPRRLDIDWRLIQFALEQGCRLTIGPDAHVMEGLEDTWYGIRIARKGWATAADILNSQGADGFLDFVAARRL